MSREEIEPETIINKLRNIEPDQFEEFVADLWEYLGYNTQVTQASSDRGIDIIATRDFPYEEKNLIQAKRYTSTVSGPELREYIALTRRDDVDLVIIVSTSGFTRQAKQEANEYDVKLVDGNTLAEIVIREGVVELVQEYSNEIASADIGQKRSPDSKSDPSQEILTTIGEGEYIEIDIVGYSYEKLQVYRTDTAEKVMMIFLEVKNRSGGEWRFRPENDLSVTSTEGYSYSNNLSSFNNTGPWQTGSVDIKRDSKARIALIYDTDEPIVPKRIEYSAEVSSVCDNMNPLDQIENIGEVEDVGDMREYMRELNRSEEITLTVDEHTIDEINSVPQSFNPRRHEVHMPSHPDYDV